MELVILTPVRCQKWPAYFLLRRERDLRFEGGATERSSTERRGSAVPSPPAGGNEDLYDLCCTNKSVFVAVHKSVGTSLSCFWSDAGLVSMLGDTRLLFREISVRPSSQFISSRNHELSRLSHGRGSACRQVSVSTAAEPKYLLNPSSLFNYPHVLEK